jgi:hypothetical protein
MAKSEPSRNPSFLKCTLRFRGLCGSSFRSCLRNRRFRWPSWSKLHLEKLGYGLVPNLTILEFKLKCDIEDIFLEEKDLFS